MHMLADGRTPLEVVVTIGQRASYRPSQRHPKGKHCLGQPLNRLMNYICRDMPNTEPCHCRCSSGTNGTSGPATCRSPRLRRNLLGTRDSCRRAQVPSHRLGPQTYGLCREDRSRKPPPRSSGGGNLPRRGIGTRCVHSRPREKGTAGFVGSTRAGRGE